MWGQKKIGESRAGEKNSEWIAGNISAIQFVLAPTFKKSQSTPFPREEYWTLGRDYSWVAH